MNKDQRARNNIFGTILTDVLPASNYRGETEDNRSILQKLPFPMETTRSLVQNRFGAH